MSIVFRQRTHIILSLIFVSMTNLAVALSLQFPSTSTLSLYARGYCEQFAHKSAKPVAGDFEIGFVNNNVMYKKFDPVTTCVPYMNFHDEFIRTPKYCAYVIGEGQDKNRNRDAWDSAYVRGVNQSAGVNYMDFTTERFLNSFNYLGILYSIGTSGTTTHIRDNLYLNHCIKGEVEIERFVDFEVDDKGRITSATVSFLHNPAYPLVPSFLMNMTYRGDEVFPYTYVLKFTKTDARGRQYSWRFDEVIQDKSIESKIRPTLLTANHYVWDYRFTPPLYYKSTGTSFPSDEELFRIAEVKKAEKEAQAKQAAAAKDPRNIPPSAPVVRESYLKHLRQIPNWAYVSLLGVAIIGWVLARASRRKK